MGGAGGGEDRFAVALQDAQPVADVIGMVGPWLGGDDDSGIQRTNLARAPFGRGHHGDQQNDRKVNLI